MGIEDRKKLISDLENKLGGRVLAVITGSRQGMETRIAPDILSLVSDHLSQIGASERIGLFLYTLGGDTTAGWGLVNLIREYCADFKILVPFRSLSCGTLIALGANEIIMGKHGLLSPVDPSVSSPFNPQVPASNRPGQINVLPVSVEDMIGFLDLARKELSLRSDEVMARVLSILGDKVHPLALGAVYRAREQTGSLATRLLQKHMNDESKINRIVKKLTQELPTHSYLIGRNEALNDIELHVKEADADLESLIWALYKDYEDWLKLAKPSSAEGDLGQEARKNVRYERAAVESLRNGRLYQHVFITEKELFKFRTRLPNAIEEIEQTAERIFYEGWVIQHEGDASQ